MQALPFPTLVIGSLDAVPILRVYLPGTTDLEQLTGRIAALGALPSVLHAGKHRIGGISTSKLPTSGDEDYMSYWGQDELKGAAWHLDRIRAPSAWTDANVEPTSRLGSSTPGSTSVIPAGRATTTARPTSAAASCRTRTG